MRVLAALAVYVAVEIGLLVLLGQAIGFLGLLAALVVSAVVGAWALKREGRRSFAELTRAARSGRPAEAEVADGMYVALAGVLLVVPGLLSTVAALVLLVPPVRRVLARRAAASAVRAGSARRGPGVVVVGLGGPPMGGPTGDPVTGSVAGPASRTARGPGAPSDPAGGSPFRGRVIEGRVDD